MNIWTVTFNDDNGVRTEVHNTPQGADEAALGWIRDYRMTDDWRVAYDWLCNNDSDFMDSVEVMEHNIHPPEADELNKIIIDYVPGRSDGDLEVDGNALVSMGDDPGAYVQCWKWIYFSDIDQEMAIIQPDGLVWYFDLFEEFMEAWAEAPEGYTFTKGTPQLLKRSDAEEFLRKLGEVG